MKKNDLIKLINTIFEDDNESVKSTCSGMFSCSCSNENKAQILPKQGDIVIAILQRGFVYIGKFYREENDCLLTNAYNIRKWGTEDKGLGYLGINGKQPNTVLDKVMDVRFDYLTVVALLDCDQEIWKKEL